MKTRNEISSEDQWDVNKMYAGWPLWQEDYENARRVIDKILRFKGRVHEGPLLLKELFCEAYEIERRLEKIFVYAHLKHDEDTTDAFCLSAYEKSRMLLEEWSRLTSFITPEITGLDEKTLQDCLNSEAIDDYRFSLSKIVRHKPHTLSEEGERLMALFGPVMRTASSTFKALNDGDIKFPEIVLADGLRLELTHGQYHRRVSSSRREERKKAFDIYHGEFSRHSLTMASLLQGCVLNHHSSARARGFKSCLDAALFFDNISREVYENLIHTVRQNIKINHRYFEVRKKILGLRELHLYDTHVPLSNEVEKVFSFDEAACCITRALACLGQEYSALLQKGFSDRWIDKCENKGKRSGAYSSGCYDSYPYILMNFDGTLHSVFTLAHELGHSMHKLYSDRAQPYHYSAYSIVIAEIVSTVNEQLLGRWLLANSGSKEEKMFILCRQIDDLRATLVRQTMFAEFELKIHTLIEKEQPLGADLLGEEYIKLNHEYYGPHVVVDENIEIEWARIPHFYYNFYVYKYATGVSAAIDIAGRILSGGEKDKQKYMDLLRAGGSAFPLDILDLAGVDLTKSDPVKYAMDHYLSLINNLEELYRS